MSGVLGKAARLAATVVLASSMWLISPATGAQAGALVDTIAVSFDDECGFYVKVTVSNTSASTVGYELGVEDVDPTSFSIAAGATKVHHWPTYGGKLIVVTSAGLDSPQSHDHAEPADCHAVDLTFDGTITCDGIVVLAFNSGEVAAQVRITRNASPVGDLLEVPAEGFRNRFVAMTDGDILHLQRQTVGSGPAMGGHPGRRVRKGRGVPTAAAGSAHQHLHRSPGEDDQHTR